MEICRQKTCKNRIKEKNNDEELAVPKHHYKIAGFFFFFKSEIGVSGLRYFQVRVMLIHNITFVFALNFWFRFANEIRDRSAYE